MLIRPLSCYQRARKMPYLWECIPGPVGLPEDSRRLWISFCNFFIWAMSLILKGRQENAHIVSRKSRARFGNMCLENVGNCTRLVQMQNGKHSVSCVTVVIVGWRCMPVFHYLQNFMIKSYMWDEKWKLKNSLVNFIDRVWELQILSFLGKLWVPVAILKLYYGLLGCVPGESSTQTLF